MENSVISEFNQKNDSPTPTTRGAQNNWVFTFVVAACVTVKWISDKPVSALTPHQKTCMMYGLARWPAHNCGPESK